LRAAFREKGKKGRYSQIEQRENFSREKREESFRQLLKKKGLRMIFPRKAGTKKSSSNAIKEEKGRGGRRHSVSKTKIFQRNEKGR